MASDEDPSVLARARWRGATAGAALLFALLGVVATVLRVPPAVVSLVLVPLVVLIAKSAVAESRAPGAKTSAAPVISRLLIGLAFVVGLPLAFISIFMEFIVSMPADCAPITPPDGGNPAHERYCESTTTAETAGMIAWGVVMGTTALLLLVSAVMAKRSKLVGWAAIPVTIAGCVIAFDLGHLVATIFAGATPVH